jgi:hypothetical protein
MIKLPRTLHIEGSRMPHGRSDPDAIPFNKLTGEFLVIEEKLDGAGASLFFDSELDLQIWHRGSSASGKEFKLLHNWGFNHYDELFDLLGDRYVMFGEWMYHKHNIFYDKLPVFFFESDVYDIENKIFLSTNARREFLNSVAFVSSVPVLAALKPTSLEQLTSLIGKSNYQSETWEDVLKTRCMQDSVSFDKVIKETDCSGLMEGLYIKHEDENQVLGRYKYVRHDFVQNILDSGTHLMDRIPIANSLANTEDIQNYWR